MTSVLTVVGGRGVGFGWCCLLAALVGCEAESPALVVDLRTDLVAGEEFSGTRVVLDLEDQRLVDERVVRPSTDYAHGARLAEFGPIPAGTHRLEVVLLDRAGAPVVSRPVLVDVQGRRVATVVVTRDCRGVVCDGEDEDAHQACLGGACVASDCLAPETGCAGMDCVEDTDCGIEASCAVGRCMEGVCFTEPAAEGCPGGEWCHPQRGCTPSAEGACEAGVTFRRAGTFLDMVRVGERLAVLYVEEGGTLVQIVEGGRLVEPVVKLTGQPVSDGGSLARLGDERILAAASINEGWKRIHVWELDLARRTAAESDTVTSTGNHYVEPVLAARDERIALGVRRQDFENDFGLMLFDRQLGELSTDYVQPPRDPLQVAAAGEGWVVLAAGPHLTWFGPDGAVTGTEDLVADAAALVSGPAGLEGLLLGTGGQLTWARLEGASFATGEAAVALESEADVADPRGHVLEDGSMRLAYLQQDRAHVTRLVDGRVAFDPVVVDVPVEGSVRVVEGETGPMVGFGAPGDGTEEVVVMQVCEPVP